jgi:hypothetical protein
MVDDVLQFIINIIGDVEDLSQIINSRGSTYAPDANNIQAAIDNQADVGGGAVWVGSLDNPVPTAPIYPRDNVTVDFANNTIDLRAVSHSFLVLDNVQNAGIQNVMVRVGTLSQGTNGLIVLQPASGDVKLNTLKNINVENLDATGSSFPGLLFNSGSNQYNINNNVFQDMKFFGVGKGIHFYATGSGQGNNNAFRNFWITRFHTAVEFECTTQFNANTFEVLIVQPDNGVMNSIHGVHNIAGTANHFSHVAVWDWWSGACPPNYERDWLISANAVNTYICAHMMSTDPTHGLLDLGTSTNVVNP